MGAVVVEAGLGEKGIRIAQANGRQERSGGIGFLKGIQGNDLVGVVSGVIVGGNIRQTDVAELHPLNGVGVHGIQNALVILAGGYIGTAVPDTGFGCRGEIVFIQGQRAGFCVVNGGILHISRTGSHGERAEAHKGQNKGQDFGYTFHWLLHSFLRFWI